MSRSKKITPELVEQIRSLAAEGSKLEAAWNAMSRYFRTGIYRAVLLTRLDARSVIAG